MSIMTHATTTSFSQRVTGLLTQISTFNIDAIGREVTRFGLAAVILWIGFMKFTAYEAHGIEPFVTNSPLMSFAYQVFSVETFSAMLGVVEVTVATLLALRFVSPYLSAMGGLLATGMFLTTLSFIVTTPGAFESSLGGFPALSITGQFLLKDIVLLGASLWSLGDSLRAITRR